MVTGSVIDGVLGVVLGVVCILAGRGSFAVSKNPAAQREFVSKWGRVLIIGGAVIVAAALIRLAVILA